MGDELAQLSEDVHRLAYRLHPAILEELGLIEAIQAERDRVSREGSIQVYMKTSGVPREMPRAIEVTLFRIVQEALCNAARHSQAKSVEISLAGMDGGLQLAVHDDGIGFSPLQNDGHRSLGLAGMKERVSLVEGELDIESAPGYGTTIVAWVPLKVTVKS
jgi:signal transduction histidine kinase